VIKGERKKEKKISYIEIESKKGIRKGLKVTAMNQNGMDGIEINALL
jgi:hypothetical protein